MTLINLTGLGVTLADPLFENLDLALNKADRLGLIAPNGKGKTTLLHCLAGLTDPTSGDVTRARNLRVALVAQQVPQAALDQTLRGLVLSRLSPEQADYESWRVDVVLDDLAVPPDLHDAPLRQLSGGWQRIALLAGAWVTEPDVLLLDEPTNHLDLRRIALLQNWLSALPRSTAIVVTSHDRAFLDAVTTRSLFLRDTRSRVFDLPYSPARAALTDLDAAEARKAANDLNKAQQLRKQAAKLKNVGINSGSDLLLTKTQQLTARAERIEQAVVAAHAEDAAGDIRLTNSGSHSRALLTLEDLTVTTPGGRALYRTGQKWIAPGDRVVLLGANGTGKTQLIRAVQRALDGIEPGIRAAPSMAAGYADQHLTQLDPDKSPFLTITAAFDTGDQRARSLLAGAGIAIPMQDKPLHQLSGGQKARLALLVLRLQHPNFYLLDEPTNHLDIPGQEMLEEELIAHGAACLLVSHDRSFVRNVGNRFWQIIGKRLVEVDDPEPFLASEMTAP